MDRIGSSIQAHNRRSLAEAGTHAMEGRRADLEGDAKGIGGAERDRTAGLLVANEALSQLSYSPTGDFSILPALPVLGKGRRLSAHIGKRAAKTR